MFTVIGCIYSHHSIPLVIAALAMCTFACVTARAMTLRARASEGAAQLRWLMGAGAVAGAGVWATHFVGMLAYQPGVPVHFSVSLTALSALIAVTVPALGGAVSVTRAGGTAGGMLFGGGVLGMHYVGMAAMEVPAEFHWNSNLILSSILLGLALGGLAGHVSALPATWKTNVGSTGLRILAILGAHFTAMAALTVIPVGNGDVPANDTISPALMACLIIAAAAFVVGQAMVIVLVHRHLQSKSERDAARLRAYIADLEATQTELRKANAAAEVANKSKSAFFASMSHELRTPLNAILGFSEMVVMETLGPIGTPKYKEYIENVHSSGRHLLSLVNDILDIARFDAGAAELEESVADISSKIRDVVRMLSAQAHKAKVRIVIDIPSHLPLLSGDRRRLRQILLNLLSNAIKFTEPGGTVTVKAWVDSGFFIRVSDTGIGMSEKDFARALEPFGQIDSSLARKYEGTGLGLPITRQLVELHGGTLHLESAVGVGTAVTVIIPAWRVVASEDDVAA